MDYATLKAFKPSEFEEAADGYRSLGNAAQAAKDHIENTVATGMRKSLQGEAAEASHKQLQALAKNFHYALTECGVISTALDGFAYDMTAAKQKLTAAVEDAQADGCRVNGDGSVTFPEGQRPGDEKAAEGGTVSGSAGGSPTSDALERQASNIHPNPNYGKAMGYANRIADALKEATDADAKWAPKIQALKADDDLTVSARDWTDVTSDTGGVREAADGYLRTIKPPPENNWPQDNANWWNGLSEEQREAYVSMHPASIGGLDGLPSAVRDDANRTVLAEQRAARQVEYDAWLKKEPDHYRPYISPVTGREVKGAMVPTEAWKEWDEKRKQLENGSKGMDAIQRRFDSYTSENTRPYLLGFDGDSMGRAIVSIGNPDTADNVVTYVPGTFAKLESIDGDIGRAEALQLKAERQDPARSTASIVWLGYDAPQGITTDATETKWADEAKEPLGGFIQGIEEANHRDGGVNQTLLGHSYGSLVVGQTMSMHMDLPVDNAIMVGSPGVGVDHAKDLNIPADRVFAATAQNDLINLAPPPAGPLAPLNPKAYMEFFDDHSIVHGTDPTSDDFGGEVFEVPNGQLPIVHGEMMPAHSQYWDEKPLGSLARIVTGGQP
ncbi:alpha/beta hydrolase family protein [Streptomyces xanthophaeus]|uniref:alpha/beta hydrolase n=1 Tax=Streptomyces xanthophaeus TaxID=67385 RepID=UPI00386B7CF6|nr:alpha/beta hydrolase family protein [Streptomyces xanthophaeus]WST62755.1 alpha/beta hydrolase family protein [Streptomyces xanthophaeus]